LTATNSSGSTSAAVTVAVNAPAGDTQPPTAPSIASAVARSSVEADLAWKASTDNVGVAGYQVVRNGAIASSLAATALSWADTSVAPGATYSYTVRAYDAAGNYSPASNTVQVTTPAVAPPSGSSPSCAAPGTNSFTGCYYGNINLTGAPVLTNSSPQIVFDWAWGFPAAPVPQSNFSARWQGNFPFAAGTYTFRVVTGDGVRVYVDGAKILDAWYDQASYSFNVGQTLTAGNHLIAVEYYDHTALPVIHVSWQ
jgi:chitodextrinase